ncbi:TPA: hypothetical protein OTY26_003223 [Pseudomonas aeruginosa]|uniref:hypothetical protein n=1 Tax=Pseudomonas aeruginosa TaxID=287 RepID=UPI001ABDF997|nr:hypothetical protein [Pseudomonas aeruginosa]MBO3776045.1 hypothetical protein [Pseudomonas aeruginosa]HCT4713611.1 hypothetical protein [Pseudomonas aeruginosa]HCT4760010.1 hypothetical protein [Pseudomonas aeruginosa]
MSIDWSKAPSSATHYLPEQKDLGWEACWYKKDGDKWLVLNCALLEKRGHTEWIVDDSEVDKFVPLLVPRSAFSSEWNGQSLPPVGTVCEWHGPNSDGPDGWVYTESKVVAYTDDGLFICMQKPSCWPVVQRIDNCEFRPLLTPEQVAAAERWAAIQQMLAFADVKYGAGELMSPKEYVETAVSALYDAGYRRQEEGK